ncbi:histidine phosphatase family protein [Niabella pedocola]|uniref:Histidine phosphatase family protein n=1 Tax=Niabella pedocola TaxID=1752077 RepID=A0ABS8PVX3_9BACT|nr:histidine phosphatase family protein [Niabella pedocola]MCD2425220.1 histidine phosphatase family protein [Niabella pedocola]
MNPLLRRALLTAAALPVFAMMLTAQQVKRTKVTFYITRHGETVLNALNRVQGWADAPLTPEGKAVAHALGLGLKGTVFNAVYASDLGRARETARVVVAAKGGVTPVLQESAELRETAFGCYEGEYNKRMWTDAALYLHYTSAAALFADMQRNNKIPEVLAAVKALDTLRLAEDFDAVKRRMHGWLVKTANEQAKAGGGNVLVVSHGIAINALLTALSEKPFVGKPLGNASVSMVVFEDGKFQILSVGDMQYVEAGQQIEKH